MTQLHKDILQHVFDALPQSQRLAFLSEIVASLDDEGRQHLSAVLEKSAGPNRAPLEPPPRASVSTPGAPKPRVDIQALLNQEPQKQPTRASAGNDSDLRQLQLSQQDTAGEMRKQMVGCIGLGIVVMAAIVGLAVGGGKLFYYLRDMF